MPTAHQLNALWLFFIAWCSFGCATTYTVADTPYSRRGDERLALSYSATAVDAGPDHLRVQLRQDACEAHWLDYPVTVTRTYKKATFLGGPGLMLGGAGAGVLGAALFVDAKHEPKTCPEGDDECVTKDDTRTMAVVASGLGAAGLIVGAYNTFKKPRLLDSDTKEGKGVAGSAPCEVEQGPVPVILARGNVELGRGQTNAQGVFAWNVQEDVMASWPPQVDVFVPNAPPVSIDISYAVLQAQMRVLQRLYAEYERERLRREAERARLEAQQTEPHAEPEPPALELEPPPLTLDRGVIRNWVHRQRIRAANFLRRHQPECQFVLGKGLDWGVQAAFSEELLAERLLEKAFGSKVEKWISKLLVWGLQTVFQEEYAELVAIAKRAKAGVVEVACAELTDLIDPRRAGAL